MYHSNHISYDPFVTASQDQIRQYRPPESWFEDPPCAPPPMLRLDPPPPPPPGPPDYNDFLMTPELSALAWEQVFDAIREDRSQPTAEDLSHLRALLLQSAGGRIASPLEHILLDEPATEPESFAAEPQFEIWMSSPGQPALEQIAEQSPQPMPEPMHQQMHKEEQLLDPFMTGGFGPKWEP